MCRIIPYRVAGPCYTRTMLSTGPLRASGIIVLTGRRTCRLVGQTAIMHVERLGANVAAVVT